MSRTHMTKLAQLIYWWRLYRRFKEVPTSVGIYSNKRWARDQFYHVLIHGKNIRLDG